MDELAGVEYVDAAIEMPKTRELFEEEQGHMEKNVDKRNRSKCKGRDTIIIIIIKQLQAMDQQVQNGIVQLYSVGTEEGEWREGG